MGSEGGRATKKNTVSSKQTHRREEGGLWALPKNYRDKYRLLAEG